MLRNLVRLVKEYHNTLLPKWRKEYIEEDLVPWCLTEEEKKEKICRRWFGGSGLNSLRRAAHLHYKLDHALNMLGGSQQPPHWDKEPTQEMLEMEDRLNRETEEACVDAVLEIAAALDIKIEIKDE